LPAKHAQAEVLLTDQRWAPVTVLAWHRLDEPFEQIVTLQWISWLVRLRLGDGSESWYEYVGLNLRPR
jgi:hypothetical protein